MALLISIVVAILISSNLLPAQNNYNWIFIEETDHIEIYYRESDSLSYEELKFVTVFETTPAILLSIVTNVDELPQWSYLCRNTKMISKINSNEYYYYYETETPWPLVNRDVVMHVCITIDSLSGCVVVNTENSDGWVPEKNDFVRIKKLRSRWVFTPIDKNHTKIEFYVSTDPGGSIPIWLFNSTISYTPVKTLTTLKEVVKTKH